MFRKEPKDTLGTEPLCVQDDEWQFGYPVWYLVVPLDRITEDYQVEFGADALRGKKILASVPAPAAPEPEPDYDTTAAVTAGDLHMELAAGFTEAEPQSGFDAVFAYGDCFVGISHVDFDGSGELASMTAADYAQRGYGHGSEREACARRHALAAAI